MSRLLEWLDVTPMVQKVSLVGLVLVLGGVGFFWMIAEPLMVQIDGVKIDIQDLEKKLQFYARSDGQYWQVQEELSRWESLVSRESERLGLDVSMSQVLSDMSTIAEDTGINLIVWKSGQEKGDAVNQSSVRHLQLHLEGGYHHIARFLDRTQYLSKMMGVTALSMDRADTTGSRASTVRATVNFMGYERKSQTLANHHQETIGSLSLDGKG